jgi:hypothetical protein
LQPGCPPNDILLHINKRDPSNVLQQEAIGILGVNLIYAAFYQLATKESFFAGLAQDVVKERIEIDFVDYRGPAFASWDRATLLAYLVHAGLAEAVFFPLPALLCLPMRPSTKKPFFSRQATSATWIPLTGRFIFNCWRQEFRNFARNWGSPPPHPLASFPPYLLASNFLVPMQVSRSS